MDLHPLIVHFPISSLIVGALCDTVGILTRKETFLRTGFVLIAVGAVAAVAAAVSGDAASVIARKIPGITEDLERHEDLSTLVAFLAVSFTLLRVHFTLKGRFTGAIQKCYLILILGLAALTAYSGYTGGRIVYDYGAGTLKVTSELNKMESPGE